MSTKGMATRYAEEVYLQKQYHAAWLPDKKISLGDIGVIEDGVFKSMNQNLDSFGIEYKVEDQDQEKGTKFEIITDGVKVRHFQAGTAAAGLGSAQVQLDFDQDFGLWVDIPTYRISFIQDMLSLGDVLLEKLYYSDPGKWKDLVIVHELITAESGNIVISSKKNSGIKVDLDLKSPMGGNLVSGNIGARSQNTKEGISEFTINDKSTPFFKIGKFIKRGFLKGTKFKLMSDDDKLPKGAVAKVVFEEDISFFELP